MIVAAGRGLLLGLDTATTEAVVAVGDRHGALIAQRRWVAGHLHGERLLIRVGEALDDVGATLGDVGTIIVGTGPGSFTGMRVGMATAKGLAFGLDVPIAGVPTAASLARAAAVDAPGESVAVLQPAGPSARYRTICRRGPDGWTVAEGPLVESVADPVERDRVALIVALDVPAASDAIENGRRALAGLPAALLAAGRERLEERGGDDLAELVPIYVSLPRGAVPGAGRIAWSRAHP